MSLAIIGTSAYASEPTEPHNADAIWLEPSIIDVSGVSVGYKFNVTAWANSSKETAGWQVWIYYPSAYLNATRAGYTAGSKSEFYQNITTLPLAPVFREENDTHNYVQFGESWFMGSYRGPGYGSLCWIEFEVMALPEAEAIPLDLTWANIKFGEPQTYLLGSDQVKFPIDVYWAYVVPELPTLAMMALLVLVTPTVLYACKKKR
jgi:hypothetical protein